LSRLYQQLCDAIKNNNTIKIDEALNLIKNEQNLEIKKEFQKRLSADFIKEFQKRLSADFSDYLNQAKLKMVEENKIISKLGELGYRINIPSYKRKRNEEEEEHVHVRPAKKARLPLAAYTQTQLNFVLPREATAQPQPLMTNFPSSGPPTVAPSTKKNTANDENFMENLKQVVRDLWKI